MLDIFEQLSKIVKAGRVCIDNNVFSLHYKLTILILLVFSLIISTRKYFGDPIDCTKTDRIKEITDQYCWFNVFVIVPRDNERFEMNYHFDRFSPVTYKNLKLEQLEKDPTYTYYFLHAYQWIEFILFIQAVAFFIPRYLWRYCFEQGRVKALTQNLNLVSVKPEDDQEKIQNIVKYFRRNRHDHFEYACKFVVCEILNFVNVLVQFLLVQRGLGIDWRTLSNDFLTSQSNIDPLHPLNQVFPNIAKCEVPHPSGSGLTGIPELCVLPVNVFITKMYIFLWFYFYVLLLISGATLVYRSLTLFLPGLRLFILKRTGKHIPDECLKPIRNLGFGDWFFFCLLGRNMDPFTFCDLVKAYGDALIASRPSFSLIGTEKLYNPDLAALHMKRESMKPAPKQ